jgi:putative restriction endonuclease
VLLVSDQANGTAGFEEALMAYHGKTIRTAQKPEWRPAGEHLAWHRSEVFKGEARHHQAG